MKEKWKEVELSQLADYVLGGDWGTSEDRATDEHEPAYVIRGSEFRNWDKEKGSTAVTRYLKRNSIEKRKLQEGDILIEISGGGPEQPVGRTEIIEKVTLTQLKGLPVVATNFLRLFRPSDDVNPYYLNYYLKYFYSTGEVVKYQGGSNNLRNLKFKRYITIKVPLPPLPEQRAIVAKLERLFTELDRSVAELEAARAKVGVYRQSVLREAFGGRLTGEYRNRISHLSTETDLRGSIKKEQDVYYSSGMEDWKKLKAEGITTRKPRRPTIPEIEENKFNDLPPEWIEVSLVEVVEEISDGPFGSKLKTSDYTDSGIRVIRLENIKNLAFDDSKKTYISDEKYESISNHTVYSGDIIFSTFISGEPKVTLVPRSVKIAVNKADCLRVVSSSIIKPKYLLYFLSSREVYSQLANQVHGATRPRINTTQLKEIRVPYTHIPEQVQVINEIESRLSVADQLEREIEVSLERARGLRQGVLKRAFLGELV